MSSKGESETQRLKRNLEEQLERLVQQLVDLEECKDELDGGEYADARADTEEQLRELDTTLRKHIAGDVTLIDQLTAVRMATQAAISQAFRTPEVIRMFARREPQQLRERLDIIDRDVKLGKITTTSADTLKTEILSALRQLGERLSVDELRTIAQSESDRHHTATPTAYEHVSQRTDVGEQSAMDLASRELRAATAAHGSHSSRHHSVT